MTKQRIFTGAATALVTPFLNGTIDYESYGNILEKQIEGKIDALVVCGTTGEASALKDEEHRALIEYTVEKVAGRVPVIAGTGSNDTEYAISLSKHACEVGADALLLVTPYYNKTSQRGLVKHYFTIADQVTKPMIIYNVPSRTGLNVLPETYAELAKHEKIVAAKEANGNITSVAQTIHLCGDSLDIYSGNDDQVIPIMSLGGIGVISVLSNILPAETHKMCQLYLDGKTKEAAKMQVDYVPLIDSLFCEVNPIPVKAAMEALGLCDGALRLPLCEISSSNYERLVKDMKEAGMKLK